MEGTSNVDFGGSGNVGESCLICGSSTRRGELIIGELPGASIIFDPLSPPAVSENLGVYFLMRHVLELPSERLENYLKHCPKLEDWVKICGECSQNYVEKCKRIFVEWLEVKRSFKDAKIELIEAIKRSAGVELEQQGMDGQEERYILDICKETRQFVVEHDYRGRGIKPLTLEDSMSKNTPSSRKRRPSKVQEDIGLTVCDDTALKDEPMSPPPFEESWFTPGENDELTAESFKEVTHNDYGQLPVTKPRKKKRAEALILAETWNTEISVPAPQKLRARPPKALKFQSIYKQSKFQDVNSSTTPYEIVVNDMTKTVKNSSAVGRTVRKKKKKSKIPDNSSSLVVPPDFFTTSQQATVEESLGLPVCNDTALKDEPMSPPPFKASWLNTGEDNVLAVGSLMESMSTPCEDNAKNPNKEEITKNLTSEFLIPLEKPEKDVKPKLDRARGSKLKGVHKKSQSEALRKESAFKCDQCQQGLNSPYSLRQHQIRIHDTNHHQCTTCEFKASTPKKLQTHTKQLHPTEQELFQRKCTTCQEVFANEPACIAHMRSAHQKRTFKCKLCQKEFVVYNSYLTHRANVHGLKGGLKYRCAFEKCGKLFANRHDFRRHKKLHEAPKHKCEYCGKAFHMSSVLRTHVESHQNVLTRPYLCEHCPKRYRTKGHLSIHKNMKHNPNGPPTPKPRDPKVKSPPCPICGVILYSNYSLQKHIESVHENKNVMCCELCGKTLKSTQYMKIHMFKAHNVGSADCIKQIPCTVEGCDKKFTKTNIMTRHVSYVHQQVRLFQCEECGKSFPDRNHLKSHVEAMHTNRESKPFKCDVCGRGFAVKAYMTLHKKKNHKKEIPPEVE